MKALSKSIVAVVPVPVIVPAFTGEIAQT